MKVIHKHIIHPDSPVINVPINSTILSVHEQEDRICVWVECDFTDITNLEIIFEVYGTGVEMPPGDRLFIDTVHLYGGSLVFHVYRKLP